MMIFIYTFAIIFVALVIILGLGNLLSDNAEDPVQLSEGKATAQMCTTRLLEISDTFEKTSREDFVIEQDLVYTYDSLNL